MSMLAALGISSSILCTHTRVDRLYYITLFQDMCVCVRATKKRNRTSDCLSVGAHTRENDLNIAADDR